ncbi:MAG: Serine/threonine-protein kinase PrkC [Candidatus Hydrogenedentes bacterium ADurb.Bin179]|nr:MAG: Serine/threonine-protein kinase PrkC [Candidatus Hydrogenedentes bacterium ADurb.Bin179]
MKQLGQYKIIGKLGAGAMGEVYLAEHQLLKVMRALKVLPGELSASGSFRERFLAEGQVLARLRHPHIVQVHDMDIVDNIYYIAMEFVSPDGKHAWSLDKLVARTGGRMAPGGTARVLHQVGEAIAYAHTQQVVHCDIKPSNILVVRDNHVCVSDFGLSKVVGQSYLEQSIKASLAASIGIEQTRIPESGSGSAQASIGGKATLGGKSSAQAASLVGTYHYMPPEVQEGGEWTPRGDLYSVGVLAYVLLLGRHPVGRWKNPSEADPGIATAWDHIINKLLAENPEDRFADAAEMNAAIQSSFHTGSDRHPTKMKTGPGLSGKGKSWETVLPETARFLIEHFVYARQGEWNNSDVRELITRIQQMPGCTNIPKKDLEAFLEEEGGACRIEYKRRKKQLEEEEEYRRLKLQEEIDRGREELQETARHIKQEMKITTAGAPKKKVTAKEGCWGCGCLVLGLIVLGALAGCTAMIAL